MGDAFEAAEMHDGARVVHRDKKVSRGMAAIVGAPGIFTMLLAGVIAALNGGASKPLPPEALPIVVAAMALFGALFVAMGIAFGVLRTVVTERAVHVKYGLWGPTIPLDAITSCKVIDYEWTRYGGWGIRRGADGTWAYVASSGPVVEIRWREGGEDKRVLVGAEDATATALAIDRAREARAEAAAAPLASGRVRVDAGVVEQAEDAEEAAAGEDEALNRAKARDVQ